MSKTGDWFIATFGGMEETQVPYNPQTIGKPRYGNEEYLKLKKDLARRQTHMERVTLLAFPMSAFNKEEPHNGM